MGTLKTCHLTCDILNLKGNQNCIISSKVTDILLNGRILPIGGIALGWLSACSLRKRLVLLDPIHFPAH